MLPPGQLVDLHSDLCVCACACVWVCVQARLCAVSRRRPGRLGVAFNLKTVVSSHSVLIFRRRLWFLFRSHKPVAFYKFWVGGGPGRTSLPVAGAQAAAFCWRRTCVRSSPCLLRSCFGEAAGAWGSVLFLGKIRVTTRVNCMTWSDLEVGPRSTGCILEVAVTSMNLISS